MSRFVLLGRIIGAVAAMLCIGSLLLTLPQNSFASASLSWSSQATTVQTPLGTIAVNASSEVINGSDGLCTLPEAIIAANTDTPSGPAAGECPAGSGPDTILLAATTYTLTTATTPNTTLGDTGLPSIASPITLRGVSSDTTNIETRFASGIGPYFRILHVAPSGQLALEHLKLTGGSFSVTATIGGGRCSKPRAADLDKQPRRQRGRNLEHRHFASVLQPLLQQW